MNSIELLTPNLLVDQDKLTEIDHWLKVMNRPQGWHYDMDIIWVLKNIEKTEIQKGDTILDAGAGMGITQFLLAARGYNVISLDFTPRDFPPLAQGIFEIEVKPQDRLGYKHDYMAFIKYGQEKKGNNRDLKSILLQRGLNAVKKGPGYFVNRLNARYQKMKNMRLNKSEKKKNHDEFGTIRFLRAPFHEIPLEDQAVCALVSVSALEHADLELIDQNINEMKRVVKKGCPLLITTSTTDKKEDWFHEKTQGWCFSEESMKKMIGSSANTDFDHAVSERNILNSALWRSRIDPYYANDPESGFYKKKVQRLPYLSAGLKIIRE